MKKIAIAAALMAASFSVAADQAVNLFGGLGAVQSSSDASSLSGGTAGALFAGAASVQGSSGAGNQSYANLGVTDEGLTSTTGSVGETYNTTDVFALGIAASGGIAGGEQAGFGDAAGVFGTIGIGLPDGLF